MVRTQLYLPEKLYKELRAKAKAKDMSFAGFIRIYLEKEVMPDKSKKSGTLYQKFPFMKDAGVFSWGPDSSNNEQIDKAIYNL